LVFSSAGYSFAISRVGYGGTDFLHGTKTIPTSTWDLLVAARPFFQIGDNYAAPSYFEVAEVTIITPDAPPPPPGPEPSGPEPGVLALLAVGLASGSVIPVGKAFLHPGG
jgi:hypothetical protein